MTRRGPGPGVASATGLTAWRVRAVLGGDPPLVSVDASVAAAARILGERAAGAVAVVEYENFIGLVTADDIDAARPSAATTCTFGEVGHALVRVPVGPLVRRNVPTVVPDTALAEAARLLREGAAPALPVLERGRLVGLVTEADLLGVLARLEREDAEVPSG